MHHCLHPFFMFELLTLSCTFGKCGAPTRTKEPQPFSAFYPREGINTVTYIFRIASFVVLHFCKCTYTNTHTHRSEACITLLQGSCCSACLRSDILNFSAIYFIRLMMHIAFVEHLNLQVLPHVAVKPPCVLN